MTADKIVLAYLTKHGVIHTRLHERGDRDIQDTSQGCGAGDIPIADDVLVTTLELLQRAGIVEMYLAVSAFDSSEYRVEWKLRAGIEADNASRF